MVATRQTQVETIEKSQRILALDMRAHKRNGERYISAVCIHSLDYAETKDCFNTIEMVDSEGRHKTFEECAADLVDYLCQYPEKKTILAPLCKENEIRYLFWKLEEMGFKKHSEISILDPVNLFKRFYPEADCGFHAMCGLHGVKVRNMTSVRADSEYLAQLIVAISKEHKMLESYFVSYANYVTVHTAPSRAATFHSMVYLFGEEVSEVHIDNLVRNGITLEDMKKQSESMNAMKFAMWILQNATHKEGVAPSDTKIQTSSAPVKSERKPVENGQEELVVVDVVGIAEKIDSKPEDRLTYPFGARGDYSKKLNELGMTEKDLKAKFDKKQSDAIFVKEIMELFAVEAKSGPFRNRNHKAQLLLQYFKQCDRIAATTDAK